MIQFASGYGTGGGLLNLTADDGEVSSSEAYLTRDMRNHHGGMVGTGAMSWAHPAISDGRLYVRNQDTMLVYDIRSPGSGR